MCLFFYEIDGVLVQGATVDMFAGYLFEFESGWVNFKIGIAVLKKKKKKLIIISMI